MIDWTRPQPLQTEEGVMNMYIAGHGWVAVDFTGPVLEAVNDAFDLYPGVFRIDVDGRSFYKQ